MNKKKIGITGGIACGKSTVLNFIKETGLEVLSCDEIANDIFQTPECQKWLEDNQPPCPDALFYWPFDKDTVRNWMLDSPNFREKYNEWIGPKIRERMLESPIEIIEVPLLFEKGLEDYFEEVWCVYVHPNLQLNRVMYRLSMKEARAKELINLQMPLEEKKKRSKVTICSSAKEQTKQEVMTHLLRIYRKQ